MREQRPEFHLHDDLSLTPAYALGYAFHALGHVTGRTTVHGRRGAVVLLTELMDTLTTLRLDASLAAAEPLRVEQEALFRSGRGARIGPACAARILAVLTVVEHAVRAELRVRGTGVRSASEPQSYSMRVLLGVAALEQCPVALRSELADACRALDARLYTAAAFHLCRVWEQLPRGAAIPAAGAGVADPRTDPALRCSSAEALLLLGLLRIRLETAT